MQGTSPAVFTDSYKLSHKGFMEPGTEVIYSNATARSDKHFVARNLKGYDGKAVVFGLQYFIKDFLIDYWNINFFSQPKEKAIGKFKRTIDAYLGPGAVSMQHFEQLHDLGYLPIRLKSLPEGSRVNMRVPYSTIQNTHKDFAWLTNYLETIWSCETWKPMTTATICYYIRKALNEAAIKTTGSIEGTQFQMHGFEFRGMSGRQDAMVNAAAMLLSTNGTDTIPALPFVEEFYNVDITKEFIATSVPATEHMVACGGSAVRGELESYRKWITEDYPTGIVSLVSDTYDYWKVLSEYLPALKQDIMNRPVNALGLSKVVIRPDSGDPYRVICGYDISTEEFSSVKEAREYVYDNWAYDHKDNTEIIKIDDKYYLVLVEFEYTYYSSDSSDIFNVEFIEISKAEAIGSIRTLWEVFGGTINPFGYKVLDSHIGLIYGDSITPELLQKILDGLIRLGFATTSIVFGVGSYTMNYNTRDSLGIAVKATYQEVNGIGYELFKAPKTDSGMKNSAKGLLRVEFEDGNFVLHEQQTKEQEEQGCLKTVFENGKLIVNESFDTIRNRLWSN